MRDEKKTQRAEIVPPMKMEYFRNDDERASAACTGRKGKIRAVRKLEKNYCQLEPYRARKKKKNCSPHQLTERSVRNAASKTLNYCT